MKRRRKIAFAVAALALIASVWLMLDHAGGPKYQGKSLDVWFREYCLSSFYVRYDDDLHEEAAKALQQIGTNAVPYLVNQAFNTSTDSAAMTNFYRFLDAMPRSWGMPAPVSSDVRRGEAAFAFKEVKAPANLLLPFMEEHLKSTNIFERRQALFILGTAGDGAGQVVPDLIAALKDPGQMAIAMQSLGWIGPPASNAVPALIDFLKPPQSATAPPVFVADVLGRIGGNAAPAIPLINEMFDKETNWELRCRLAAASFRIDSNQTEAFAFLTNGLMTHQPVGDRWRAAHYLGDIGPNAKAAAPALLQSLDDATNGLLFRQSSVALKALGISPATIVSRMKAQLDSPGNDETTRVNVAARMLEVDPSDHDAQMALLELIRKNSGFASFAADTLGRAGPAAKDAVPVLREVSKSDKRVLREEAAKALKKIEAKDGAK